MQLKRYNGLDVRLTGGPDREGGGNGPVVILLHGFGAPGDDLVSLWRMVRVPDTFRFVFPAAPLHLPGVIPGGRAWWMLDIDRMARDVASGRNRDLRIVPDGSASAREQLLAMLDALDQDRGLSASHVFLGGFSQGAMLACDLVVRSARPFAGLIVLSGSIMAQQEWEARWPARTGLPVFQSHGTDDPVLSYDTATHLRDTFRRHGLPVAWHAFRGGHEIPVPVLDRLGSFLTTPRRPS